MRHFTQIISKHLLIASVVLAVVGAGTASASEPKVEPHGGFPVTFAGHGGTGELTTVPDPTGKVRSVHCIASATTGEIDSATSLKNVLVHFKGCTAGPLKLNCNSPGRATGE